MASPTFRFQMQVPPVVVIDEERIPRDEFFTRLWATFGDAGLCGIHEGTLLSEDAIEQGLATEPWIVDAGKVPEKRDWVGEQGAVRSEIYFSTEMDALGARNLLASILGQDQVGSVEEVKAQDWDAEWKSSWKGVDLHPWWRIDPPWAERPVGLSASSRLKWMRINPGAGFGTGTHETTQLCLQVLGELGLTHPDWFAGRQVLDFGSGSGILSIAAGMLGAKVVGVEIDPLANENASENAKLNGLEDAIQFVEEIPSSFQEKCQVVVANILKPVLLEFADRLINCLDPTRPTTVILSGLIAPDVEVVRSAFESKFSRPFHLETRSLHEWRAMIWRLDAIPGRG